MDVRALRRQLLESVALLELLEADSDARLLHSDILRAGHDVRKLLMLREDAERLLEAVSFD